jgi:hypothetical protein
MNVMRILFLLAFLIPDFAFSQQRSIALGSQFNYFRLRDEGMSPLRYQGAGFGINSEYNIVKDERLQSLRLDLHYARIKHGQKYFGPLHNGVFSLSYSYLFPINLNQPVKLKAGISADLLTAFRYHPWFLNSAINYDIFFSMAPAFSVSKTIATTEKNPLTFEYFVAVPLAAFVLRPAYASPFLTGLQSFNTEYQTGIIRSIRFQTLPSFIRFQNRASMIAPLGKNTIRMSYEWGIYNIRGYNPVIVAHHAFYLSYIFILKG